MWREFRSQIALLIVRVQPTSVLYISDRPANGVQELPASNIKVEQVVALAGTDELATTLSKSSKRTQRDIICACLDYVL